MKLQPGAIVVLVLGLGIAFFSMVSTKPSSCTIQYEGLKKAIKGQFAFAEEGSSKREMFSASITSCRFGNSKGACLKFFELVQALQLQLNLMDKSCLSDLNSTEVKSYLGRAFNLFIQLGWGERPTEVGQFSWLSQAEVALFCQVKGQLVQMAGEASLDAQFKQVAPSLPGLDKELEAVACDKCTPEQLAGQANAISRAKSLSLLMVKCQN